MNPGKSGPSGLSVTALTINDINRVLINIQSRLSNLEGIGQVVQIKNIINSVGLDVPSSGQIKINGVPLDLQPLKVGAYYFNSGNNPAAELGYGTWEQAFKGRFLVGQKDGDSDFGTEGTTGGAKTSTPNAHSGTDVANHAAHTHAVDVGSTLTDGPSGTDTVKAGTDTVVAAWNHYHTVDPASVTSGNPSATLTHSVTQPGNHAAMNILPPFEVLYVWKRIS
jgi:hypothetical protein